MRKTSSLLTIAGLIFATVGLGPAPRAEANEIRGIIRNNEGVRRYGGGRLPEAYERFNDAMVDLPFSPEVHFNLGNSFLASKEPEKALNEFMKSAELAKGDSARAKRRRFESLFNAAVASTELKRNDDALELYQKALELEPGSMEVKTNIELLTQQGGEGGEGDQQQQEQQDKGDQKDKNKQGEGQDQKDQQQQQQPKDQQAREPKPTPRPFKSEEVSPQDVGRILEELKRQEEQIRAKMQGEGAKDAPPDKDW